MVKNIQLIPNLLLMEDGVGSTIVRVFLNISWFVAKVRLTFMKLEEYLENIIAIENYKLNFTSFQRRLMK